MLPLTIGLALAGIGLFVGAPALSRLILGRARDRVALTRIFQAAGVVLIVVALVVAPYNPETTAVPPPPDMPDPRLQ